MYKLTLWVSDYDAERLQEAAILQRTQGAPSVQQVPTAACCGCAVRVSLQARRCICNTFACAEKSLTLVMAKSSTLVMAFSLCLQYIAHEAVEGQPGSFSLIME